MPVTGVTASSVLTERVARSLGGPARVLGAGTVVTGTTFVILDPGVVTAKWLSAAQTDGAGAMPAHVVLVSSAVVYGAWPNNPVPLSEEAPLRPNSRYVDAARYAEAERVLAEWVSEHPALRLAVLRPVPVVGPGQAWLTRALLRGVVAASPGAHDGDPPRQFLHVDDLVVAIVQVVAAGLDGTFNVTPDGWVSASVVRALVGRRRRDLLSLFSGLPAFHRVAHTWRSSFAPEPTGVVPLLAHPWVVANDRLRAAGWFARYSNEEAIVAGHPPPWWRGSSAGAR